MSTTSAWALLGFHLLATASPGPDFAVVLRNSLQYSRLAGVMTATGVAVSNAIHLGLAFAGIRVLLEIFPHGQGVLQRLGALYLITIGWGMIRSQLREISNDDAKPPTGKRHFFGMGFLTSLLNAKAMIYFVSVSALLTGGGWDLSGRVICVLAMLLISFSWFATVALCAGSRVRLRLTARQLWRLDQTIGLLLLVLGLGLFVSA